MVELANLIKTGQLEQKLLVYQEFEGKIFQQREKGIPGLNLNNIWHRKIK